jgi:hypothetical protein
MRRAAIASLSLGPDWCIVREFRVYQEELARFLRETQPAEAQSQRGKTRPLDVDAVMFRVQRLPAQAGSH